MPKFSIAFILPSKDNALRHRVQSGDTQDAALRQFFKEEVSDYYSNDEQGYYYFKEDFFEETSNSGSIIQVD